MNDSVQIGQRLQQALELRGRTQLWLVERWKNRRVKGKSRGSISATINGRRSPSRAWLERFAGELGVRTEWLETGVGPIAADDHDPPGPAVPGRWVSDVLAISRGVLLAPPFSVPFQAVDSLALLVTNVYVVRGPVAFGLPDGWDGEWSPAKAEQLPPAITALDVRSFLREHLPQSGGPGQSRSLHPRLQIPYWLGIASALWASPLGDSRINSSPTEAE